MTKKTEEITKQQKENWEEINKSWDRMAEKK